MHWGGSALWQSSPTLHYTVVPQEPSWGWHLEVSSILLLLGAWAEQGMGRRDMNAGLSLTADHRDYTCALWRMLPLFIQDSWGFLT